MSEERPARPSDIARAALEAARAASASRPRPTRRRIAGPKRTWSGPRPGDDDPQPLGRLVDHLVRTQDWTEHTRVGTVFGRWSALVGPDIAAHCTPQTLTEGELLVVAESTAWATQLRLLAPTILAKLHASVGGDVVTRLRVVGPTAPSWKKGPRSVRGRGTRTDRSRPARGAPGGRPHGDEAAMSSPRDRDGFEQRPDDGSGWREPGHLGGDGGTGGQPPAEQPPGQQPPADGPAADRPAGSGGSTAWQPPGWDLPPAAPDRPARPPAAGPQTAGEQPVPGGLFGSRQPRRPSEIERVFAYQGDAVGAQAWAVQQGWAVSDGTAPEDAALAELVRTAPVRATKDHRPAGVVRGRYGTLDLVAFDVLYASGRYAVPEYAVTAAPVLGALPPLRLSPARFWKHRTGGLVQVPSGDPTFDTRWVLLAAEDGPAARALVGDATVRGLLLGSDDGDEFWTAAGHLAAIRPDGHRPQLIEHHARLLTAIVSALAPAL